MKLTDGCVAGGTRYTPRDAVRIDVLDTCHDQTPGGKLKSIGGPAKISLIQEPTRSFMSITSSWDSCQLDAIIGCWITDESYTWFISANPTFTNLWIYTRTPDPDPALVKTLVGKARSMGYDVTRLEFPAQP